LETRIKDRIAEPSERPDRHAVLALWASAVGFGVEGFDLLILVFLLAPIGVAAVCDEA
jgi:hypothetical protein